MQEAEEFFYKLNPKYYLFSTENQESYTHPETLSFVARFTEIIISRFNRRICFKRNDDILCFSNVKNVKVDENPSIGVPFYIVCADKKRKNGETKYTIIASKNIQ